MLQDTAAGGAFLARHHQRELRASAGRAHRLPKAASFRRRRAIRLRPTGQPSFIVQPRPAQLRKLFAADVAPT
jgi:hypothetical protein